MAVGVICAETHEEADYLAASVRLLQRRIRLKDRRPVAAPEDALRELRVFGDDGGGGRGVAAVFCGDSGEGGGAVRGDGGGFGDWGGDREYDCLGVMRSG